MVVVYERRDSIARDLANRFLADSGVEVSDVSLHALTATRVEFDTLALRLAGGTRIDLERLEVPIEFPGLNPAYVDIGSVVVTPPEKAVDPSPLAPVVRNVLGLPSLFARTAVTVERLLVVGVAEFSDLVWASADDFQRLHVRAGAFTLDADIERADAESHTVTVELTADGTSALAADAVIIDRMGEVQINAYGSVVMAPWIAALREAGLLPAMIDDVEGTVLGMASIRPDSEQAGRLAVTLTAASDEALRIATALGGGVDLELTLPVGQPSELRWEWPAGRWSLRSPELRVSSDIDGLESLPVRISDLDCSDEIACDLSAAIGPGTLKRDNLAVDRVMMTLPLEIRSGDVTSVTLSRDPTVFLTGVRAGGVTAGAINTLGVDGARLVLGDAGAAASLDGASLTLSTIAADDLRLDALAMQLANLTYVGNGLEAEFATAANSGTLAWRDFTLRLPGTDGRLTWRDEGLDARATVTDDRESLAASVALRYGGADRIARIDLEDARVDFGRRTLREWVGGIGHDLDIVAGTALVSGVLDVSDEPVDTQFEISLEDLAGHYADVAATGIGGRLTGNLSGSRWRLGESVLRAALVDVGLPLENLGARFSQSGDSRFDVEAFELELLGGRITADPFAYDFGEEANRLLLKPEGIQLPLMAKMAGFETLDVEGSLGGGIPVMIKAGNILIENGRLENAPPGGVIRFNADVAATAAANANLDIASRALRNFHFDSLTSAVDYDEQGDLTLRMRLSGVNPDMDPNQPVILNLNVENNIPELLRSLQAVRSIEEIIGRESARQ